MMKCKSRFRASALAVAAVAAALVVAQGVAGASNHRTTIDGPTGMVVSDGHLWVVNTTGNSVTEIDASDGSLVTTVRSPADHFDFPETVASSGADLWVANNAGDSVTELSASNGALVRVISATKYHFDFPGTIVFGDSHLWIANGGSPKHDESIVELNPANGALVRIIHSTYISNQSGIAVDGSELWLTNAASNTVAEFATSNGSLTRVIDASSYHIDDPLAIKTVGGNVWVSNAEGSFPMIEINASTDSLVREVKVTGAWSANPNQDSSGTAPGDFVADGANLWIANNANVVEIDEGNGSLVKVISAATDDFDFTRYIVTDGPHVWTSNYMSNSITELDASNGALERVIH
jgi:streptogramin lyase